MSRAVIDQPGLRIFTIGLVISIFIGLALRSQISESRIQVHIDRSIDRLKSDFNLDYESAKVTLSRWGLPFPALVVTKLRLSPKNQLCQNTQIYVEELEVPISILNILGINNSIPKVRIKEIELRLSDIEKCIARSTTNAELLDSRAVASSDTPADSAVTEGKTAKAGLKNLFFNQTDAALKEIYIEKLKIIFSKKTDQPIILKQLSLDFLYKENNLSELNIKAQINAIKDTRTDVYFLNSDLVAVIKAKENNQIESILNINGKLLDGDIHLFAQNITNSNNVLYELNLGHVSAKALYPLFGDIRAGSEINFDKVPVSISFKSKGEFLLNGKTEIETKFKYIQVYVENGLLKIDELALDHSGSQLRVSPFILEINKLPLSVLKDLNKLENKLDSFESLGNLTGRLEYETERSYSFNGELKDIKAVFSNRGRRDLQNIEHINIKIVRGFENIKFEANDFVINKQMVGGKFSGQYNVKSTALTADLKFSGVTLDEKIWKQFTFVEQSPKMEVSWNYIKNSQETHSLKIYSDKILLPGITMTGLNINIDQVLSNNKETESLHATIKPVRLTSDPSFIKNKIIKQILNIDNGFKLDVINSSKTNLVLSGSNWKNVNFELNSNFLSDVTSKSDTYLSFKGSVIYQNGMNAKIIMKSPNVLHKFNIMKNSDDEMLIRRIQ
ncbi:MAG: hypothetical protein AABY53_07540 [Bdellovibrionota bacterium]